MLTPVCQRWRARRDLYRPAGEPIVTRHYEVARIDRDNARAFVEQHHYERSFPAAVAQFGLFRGELVGVAVLSQPASQAALDAALPFSDAGIELGRFVLLDQVPSNGESWFLARAFELARRDGFEAIVAHSDPQPRATAAGDTVFIGHIGGIYQATNAVYCGLTPRRTRRLLPNGLVLSRRAISKLNARARGWRYVVDLLVRYGAPPPSGDWRAWCALAVDAVSRPVRHTGNHRYVWALDRRLRRHLPEGKAYPKLEVRRAA